MRDGHLGHVTMTIFTKFMYPLPMEAQHKNLVLIGHVDVRKNNGNMYIAPRQGQTTPRVIFFKNVILPLILSFAASFSI